MIEARLNGLRSALGKWRTRLGTGVAEVRVTAACLVLLLAKAIETIQLPPWAEGVLFGYISLSLILVPILRKRPSQKRIRILPELLDIAAISLLVTATGGLESAWFVLYLFPVMSTARFMGSVGILGVVLLAGVGYTLATSILYNSADESSLLSFILRGCAVGGVSLMAANLVRTRDKGEGELLSAFERVNSLILEGGPTDRVMGLVLKTALKLTLSDVCAMVLLDGDRVNATFAEATDPPLKYPHTVEEDKQAAIRIVHDHIRQHQFLNQPLAAQQVGLISRIAALPKPRPRGEQIQGCLLTLDVEGTVIGVLGAFTRRGLHYFTDNDLRKLTSLAPLVAVAQKNAKLFRESRKRLELAYRIGGQLKTEYGLDDFFQSVVDLVSEELLSEEAALFLAREEKDRLEKKAVSGPAVATRKHLLTIETAYYPKDKSLTLSVFRDKKPNLQNDIKPDEAYASAYSGELPSKTTRHYIGVPLLIGDEVLGVIRVLNKKALDYQPDAGSATLASEGFREDDLELITFIATQVAAAIRNAKFIEQKLYFENLVYTSPDPTLVVDDQGRIRNFNRACEEIWSRSETDVVGCSVAELYPSLEHARRISRCLWSEKSRILRNFETSILGPGEEVIPIRLSAALLVDSKGAVFGSIGIFRDQREILRLEEERILNEKLAALGRLAQTASHDIKHDFGTILGNLRPIEMKLQGDATALRAARSIRTAANEALDKIQRMLLAARPKPPDRKIARLNEHLKEFLNDSFQRASVMNVDFLLDAPKVDVIVFADVELLRQVFANLFTNSLDAIREARQSGRRPRAQVIKVTLEDTSAGAQITWRDDGCGMSPEVLNRAFTAFNTTKRTGSGLGLSVTRTIIENHGGEISIDSEEGSGTSIRFTIPHPPEGSLA